MENIPTALLPTRHGNFELKVFLGAGGVEHMVLVKGAPVDDCLVRLHSECATGDVLGSLRCDCRNQLEKAMELIDRSGCGLLIYMRGHEGRGIGLANKIRAYALQEQGMDTIDANVHLGFAPDARDYADAVAILKQFKLKKVRLLTNNRDKVKALQRAGIAVSEHVSLWTATNPHNEKYIATKRVRMGHA
ncbi:MAG: GTP cyclohydrolase II [Alphaproteobacteria bacterium]|nr:GTP cyclohydrolase II [Alphaproteobacteria bacterium]